jgi:hypothetical protein
MENPSPREQIGRMVTGYWIAQAVHVAARLGVADLLRDGPRSAAELATATQTQPRALYRLLRALASVGVFAEDDRQRFALTPLADCLRSDVPGSQRAMTITAGELFYPAWAELLYSVQTGKVAFDKVYGMPVFDYLTRNPDQARLFDETMVGVHGRETGAMLDAYDLGGIRVLADIGGGNGSLLIATLTRHPALRGILYDLPGVAENARARIAAAGLADRCQVIGGSFFDDVPAGADAYLLRHIIHDWDEKKSIQILQNVHQAMPADGRLLLVESVIPEGNEPSFGKLLDLAMMVIPGGEERTAAEYEKLYVAAGFRLTRIVPTAAEVSVIEGQKV